MTISRRMGREWLDDLPPDDPRAIRSRRDLRLINRIMGTARILERALRANVTAARPRIAELGAGDGTLMLRVAQKLGWREAEVTFVDRRPAVEATTLRELAQCNWCGTVVASDVFAWLENAPPCDAIVANLFLHHFGTPELARLLERAASRTKTFIASEPERSLLPLAGSYLVGLLGCNDVTRHDAVLSVRAGFHGKELSQLWPHGPHWTIEESASGLFTHRFVALR